MSGGPVSVSGPHPPIGTTPRLAPKARTGRQADPRRSSHQGPGGASLPAPSIRKRAEPGVSAKPPQKTAGRGQTASGHGPLPRHSIQSGQKTGGSGKGRKRRGKEERRGRRGRREGRRKGGRKPESRKAEKRGSGEAGKRGSRKAGKPESGEAGKRAEAQKGIKKRRRTVGCTSACGSQRSLAYRNYLLR
jgi:hypothetical protein